MSTKRDRLIGMLQAKYREDPNGFRGFLPGAAELLPELPPERRRRRAPTRLTERELSYHREGLSEVLQGLDQGTLTSKRAVKGLQHCAALIKDDNLPYTGENEEVDASLPYEMGHDILKNLLREALGKSPGSYRSKTTVPVGEGGGPVLESISVIMGVFLDLNRNGRLVSVSIHPGTYKKRRKAMAIIGIGSDPEPDVALRHYDYLAMQDPHGNA